MTLATNPVAKTHPPKVQVDPDRRILWSSWAHSSQRLTFPPRSATAGVFNAPEALTIKEVTFQHKVVTTARHNGWSVTLADIILADPGFKEHPKDVFAQYLRAYAAKMYPKIKAFFLNRRLHTFTYAYHTHDSRKSQKGFPDLVLVHPHKDLIYFVELKKHNEYPRLEQRLWLAALAKASRHSKTAHVFVWRPKDWQDIVEALGGIDPYR